MVTVRLSKADEDTLYALASKLTGTCQEGKFRHQVIITNVLRRMSSTGAPSLDSYLGLANSDSEEFEHLVSSLTIHTTSWFRESPHYARIEQDLLSDRSSLSKRRFRVLSAACSSGEEVYSCALVLETIRAAYPGFEYEVYGADIDGVSVAKARRAIYSESVLTQIPRQYYRFLLKGRGSTRGQFTLSKEIRKRCHFRTANLTEHRPGQDKYDLILCRNVLIYFSPEEVEKIVRNLSRMLTHSGALCLGHSEAVDPSKFRLRALGNATYTPLGSSEEARSIEGSGGVKVLIIDDSSTIRTQLVKILGTAMKVHAVASADEATRFLENEQVDIVTLDLHMPGQSGAAWLRAQRGKGFRVPVVILSGASQSEAFEVLGALEHGAQDYIDKSALHKESAELSDRIRLIAEQHKTSQSKRLDPTPRQSSSSLKVSRPDVILIGASTGGTEVLTKLLRGMPPQPPPILVAQHITSTFARPFAHRLSEAAGLILDEPADGAPLERGRLYMAFDDSHVGVSESGNRLRLVVSKDPPVNRHRPSVDFLFRSGAALRTNRILACILTGMGADGASGLLELRNRGCVTAAQDEASCVVFGMPREAIKLGAAQVIGNPSEIRALLERCIKA